MVYLDENGLNELWAKIKKNFAKIGEGAVSKGSIMYFNAAKAAEGNNAVSTLSVPSQNADQSVLGVSSGVPAWKVIIPTLSITQNGTSSSTNYRGYDVTVGITLGSNSFTANVGVIPPADTSKSGIVTTAAQTFAGAKTFNSAVSLGSTLTVTDAATLNSTLAVNGTATMQTVRPKTNNGYSLGTSSYYWASLYANNIRAVSELSVYIGSTKEISITSEGLSAIDGGVAANGLADLSVSGSGGGSGTVKEIYIGSTLYPTDVDGKVILPAYPSDFYTTSQADSIFATQTALGVVTGKIPSAASSSNQLADKAFVNSSIATATATFRGTNTTATTEAAFLTWANGLTHSLNDYVFWKTTDSVGNVVFKRYKYGYDDTETGTLAWRYEYDLNNSSFTSDQWNAINSGVTSSNWVKTADIKTLTFGSGTTTLVYTPNSGNSRSLLAGSHLSFSISGSNATLNVSDVADSSSASAISTGTSLVSERDVYHGLPTINNAHNYTSNTSIYAPTGAGTAGQYLKSAGETGTPVWESFNAPALSWTNGTSSGPVLNLTPSVGSSLTATIPAARKDGDTYYSGVVTTGSQTFKGTKTFDGSVRLNSNLVMYQTVNWAPSGETPTDRIQDLALASYSNANIYGGKQIWGFYSYQPQVEQEPSPQGPGVGYMPMMIGGSGTGKSAAALFYSGSTEYSGARLIGWGIGTPNNNETLDINGTLGVTDEAIFRSKVGIGSFTRQNPTEQHPEYPEIPDANLHVKGTSHITGISTLDNNLYITNNKIIYWKSDNIDYSVLNNNSSSNTLSIGYGISGSGGVTSETKIYGTSLSLYYGANRTLGTTLDSNGILTNVKSIQSTGGGVAAMGLADLALSGGGGGSGTVQSLQVNNATPIIPDTDGKLSLVAALESNANNAVSLAIGGDTLNITQSALRTSLGLGAAAYKPVGSVASGNTGLVEGGAVYSNTVSALSTSGNYLTWTKGGTTTPITVPFATNADTVDGVQLAMFYKAGRVYTGSTGSSDTPWYLIAEGILPDNTSGSSVGTNLSLYVSNGYQGTTVTSLSYGILNIKVYFASNAVEPSLFFATWTLAQGIDVSDFVATYFIEEGRIKLRLWCNRNAAYRSYSFTKLAETTQWSIPCDYWTINLNVTAASAVAAIPEGETQAVSIISDINNKSADSAKLGGQLPDYYATATSLGNYLPLTGGTMTLNSGAGALTLNTNQLKGVVVRRTQNENAFITFNGLINTQDTEMGAIGFRGVDNPVFRNSAGVYNSLWHAGNTALSVSRDAQDNATSFTLQVGTRTLNEEIVANDVTVGPIPSYIIAELS